MIFETLLPASYKGVSFLVSKADTDIGRKQAEYNYPFTNKKRIEDLGLKPRTYKLTCVIHGAGAEYTAKRTAFLAVLEDGKKGVLIHPFYGLLQNMVARPVTITEDLTNAGVLTVDVTFDQTDDQTQPTVSNDTLSQITDLNTKAVNACQSFLTNTFGATFVQNVKGAIGSVTSFASYANNVVSGVTNVAAQVNDYKTNINSMLTNPVKYALDSAGFSTSAFAALNDLIGIVSTPNDATKAYRRYYTFNDNVVAVPETTPARTEYNQNNQSLRIAVQVAALANSQLTACLETYATVDDIDNANAALEQQFNKVMEYNLDPDLLTTLSNLRATVNNYLEQQKLTAAQIEPVYTNQIPAAALSYQYYGTTDRIDEIVSLNNAPDVSFIEGNIVVLSQ